MAQLSNQILNRTHKHSLVRFGTIESVAGDLAAVRMGGAVIEGLTWRRGYLPAESSQRRRRRGVTEEIDETETDQSTCARCGDRLADHPSESYSLESIEHAIRMAERDELAAHLRGDVKTKAEHIRQAVRLRCVAERAYAIWLP